jgi:hypothetical protein
VSESQHHGSEKNVHKGSHGSERGVHIHPKISTKNLRLLEKKLHGAEKRAVREEINRRDEERTEREARERAAENIGELLGSGTDAETIIELWWSGVEIGKRRKSGH